MIGIQIATVPLLLINADINEHTALTVTINRLSVLARKEFPIFSPIFLAIPVSKSAALTTHIPTTIGQPVALNPLYTADKSISGINIAIATDPRIAKEQVEGYGAKYYEDYVELLKDSDVVSIHVPLTDQTRNMISKKELSVMKPTALIINCSRGGIINEADLVEALNNGVIAGAGTDVFCSEPPKTDDPLLNCRNLIVSPHSAAQTREAVIKMAQMCIKGCLAVVEGKKWPYVADKSVYEHEKWKGADWAEI